ncbi:hypothetical protein [Lysobacter sp. 1R34A]|uniref:hypothetical protein n=1 Tax=Lysobacter sp. 1R34A TaxID=3445786 RepID=UPI003EEC9B8A
MKYALQTAGPLAWGLLAIAALVFWLMPSAWLLRGWVAQLVKARPAYGAALWSVVFALVVWAMLAVTAMIVLHGQVASSGWPFATVAFALSCLALAFSVRIHLPGPDGVRLSWARALPVSAATCAVLWVQAALCVYLVGRNYFPPA